MATDTDLVASKAAALRLAQEMGCSGAHQHPDGKWMPCATMKEYEELVKKDKKNTVRVVEQRRRYRNSKGKNKRDWEPLAERGITAIDTIAGGGLVSGSVKVAPWAPDEEDPDVFSNPRLARRRSRQLGCIGVSRRVSRNGNVVWMPCSNMTDYAKRTGSTAFGRNFQRRRARRTLERAVAREVRRQLRRKKSLMEELYEGKALGRKLNRARVATTTPFDADARDADMDMLVQEGTPWERPARPRVPGLASARTGRRRAERWADRAQRRRDLRTERRDQRTFERDMEEIADVPITDTELDQMAEYYEFAEATGGLQSVRGFKLTEEEQRDRSEREKAAKYRKATLDAVGEEHRGKPVRRVHWVYGAPGSGKTARTNLGHLQIPDTSEAAHTNPDDYKRFHPLWNYGEGSVDTHQFSRGESAKTIRDALKEGMDVVVQGTGKDGLLMNATIFEGGDYKKGRRRDTVSVMHFLHVPDDERARRIFDRGARGTPATGQTPRDQRRRYGAEPEDAMNVLDQVVKYIEEGRVDEAHIYDNSGPIDESPPLVATFKDGNLVIYDEDAFEKIFNPIDHNGQPTVFRGPVADRPAVTRYSRRDDPRRGKTYAERLREEGENPGGFRKWDEEQREQGIRESKANGLMSRRGEEGESLQDAYRRHKKATRSLTQSEQAFEEQYGYELSSGDGDCYSASYRAAMELVEKGVDVDGDPITNVRVVVGSPIFPAIGNRSGHAWVEYDVVKPPPPVMSSADTERAREQILELVEEMGLPPKQKQATIDSFVEAIDRANEANASMPARDVTMVRDYASVRDGDEILEFDDMDRGRLEELKPDMTRDEYYAAGEMEEVDIAGRFSPAEYEETQVGLFGDNFYDGDATFLTRKQVDDHLEDMGIDGGLESKRTDDADAEDVRLHDEAIEQLREIFAEAGAEQSDTILDQLAYEMRASPRGMMGGDSRPIKPEHLEAIRELVDERDPEFMEDLVESQRIRQTTAGYRRLTESGLDSGVGNHGETTTRVRGSFDAHIEDGDPITLYHGGPVDLTGDVDYEVGRNDSGQWGPGVYTTSSAFPAIKGWANPWQRNAEGGYDTADPGHLHTTRWKGENPPRILDVEDPIPDDVIDGAVIPAAEALLREIDSLSPADKNIRGYDYMVDSLEEELQGLVNDLSEGKSNTGRDTLLRLQQWMQEYELDLTDDESYGFLPSDRIKIVRDGINAALRDLGYDVIKSHEVGIREMSRTDYMFLDPDMVEFVDVATTHSLGGFGNAAQGEMAATVRKRATARKEAT